MADEESANVKLLRSYLDRHVRIDLDDGRIVVGRFRCTDDKANVVLDDACEVRTVVDSERESDKMIFRTKVLLIPQRHVVKFSVDLEHIGSIDPTAAPRTAIDVAPVADVEPAASAVGESAEQQ
eukprot:TRINITY_DN5761_c0_g1_i1.p3 TRINITY_DN5761_c0_g1~~TRINITY_DN5761_c0_g1_i1.p3  ORF type:complete len:124 (+),score=21.29 TRINITY_DN5761_c0_g1_i1:201-572(+)